MTATPTTPEAPAATAPRKTREQIAERIAAGYYTSKVEIRLRPEETYRSDRENHRRDQARLDCEFHFDLLGATDLPVEVSARFYKLMEAEHHADGRAIIAQEFYELCDTVVDGFKAYFKREGLAVIPYKRATRKSRLRPPPKAERVGDGKASLHIDNDDFALVAQVALADGTYRTATVDIRDVAGALYTELGA